MKALLPLLILFALCSSANAQTATQNVSDTANGYAFQYIVGTTKIAGYEIKICDYLLKTTPIKKFSNGKSAPILQVYVENKTKYIGGILENEKGQKTVIKDIGLTESGNTLLFTVTGNDFSMSFTLSNGSILKEENDITVFYTDLVGAWKINKKP